jgi:hypothetical protein
VRDLGSEAAATAGGVVTAPTQAEIEAFIDRLAVDAVGLDDAERIDRIAALERLRCASEAAQTETICRSPGCGAPIRHTDHVGPRSRGGPTTADNGQGLCEHCNYVKEADGWSARVAPGPRHTVETTTPTGHLYTSTAEEF